MNWKLRGFTAGAVVVIAAAAIVGWRACRNGDPDARSVAGAAPPLERAPSAEIPSAPPSPRDDPSAAAATPAVDPAPAAIDEELLLRGRVVDPSGVPVAGADLDVRRSLLRDIGGLDVDLDPSRLGESVAAGESSADGTFSFPLLRAIPHVLVVTAAGFATEHVADRYAGQFVTVWLRRGASVFGRVTRISDGTPVAGATARLLWSNAPNVPRLRTETESDGSYEFPHLAPGDYALAISAEDAGSSDWYRVIVAEDENRQIDVALARGFAISGRVTSALTGEPIAGAEVGESWVFQRVARTDADGRYEIAGFGGPFWATLSVRAAGFGLSEWEAPEPVTAPVVVDFALNPARAARGRIVDGRGAPVSNAYVAAIANDTEARPARMDWRSAHTTFDGTFELLNLRPDLRHALVAGKDGFGSLVREFPPSENESASIDLGDLRLPPPALVLGSVVDEGGAGVPGVEVTLARNEPKTFFDDYMLSREIRTDEDGRFRFAGLGAGHYRLLTLVRGRATGHQEALEIALGEGETRADVRIVLATGLSIAGVVEDQTGERVPFAFLNLSSENREPQVRRGLSVGVVADAEGAFRFSGLESGTYTVHCRPPFQRTSDAPPPRLAPASVTGVEAGATDLRIVMQRPAVVKGVVREASGDPASRVSVTARRPGGESLAGAIAGSDGTFALDVPEGETIVDLIAKPAVFDEKRPLVIARWTDEGSTTVTGVRPGATDVVIILPARD